MQQQLFCTDGKWVDFAASVGSGLFVKSVVVDLDFWSKNLWRLESFHYNVILLELAYQGVK